MDRLALTLNVVVENLEKAEAFSRQDHVRGLDGFSYRNDGKDAGIKPRGQVDGHSSADTPCPVKIDYFLKQIRVKS